MVVAQLFSGTRLARPCSSPSAPHQCVRNHSQKPRCSVIGAAASKRVASAAASDASPPPPPLTTPGAAAGERAALAADALLDELRATTWPGLSLPSARHQPTPLPRERLRALRAECEELAKHKALPRLQVGAKGLTPTAVSAAADALGGAPAGLLRVRLGDGCGLERRAAAAAMERLLDAVCVKQVGFCVTLYREPGLPRPDNVPLAAGGGGATAGGAAAAAAAAEEGDGDKQQRPKNGARKDKKGEGTSPRSASPPPPPKPPAFSVV